MTQPSAALDGWIERFLDREAPRSKSLVVTIFGDSIAPRGGAVWLGGLIGILAPFRINDRLVRTSMFRLTEDGWFEPRRHGRRSLYALTAQGMRRFGHAYRRIYRAPDRHWDGSWTLVLFARTAAGSADRVELKKDLKWEGFGPIAPGLFARPAVEAAVLDDILGGPRTQGAVFAMRATDLAAVAARPTRELVDECWDLADLAGDYRRFLERFEPARALLRAGERPDARQAFQLRTLLVHEYRRVILHDPQFPAELLPPDWPGFAAYDLCRDVYSMVLEAAESHLAATLQGPHGTLPAAGPDLLARFGGIEPAAVRTAADAELTPAAAAAPAQTTR